MFRRSIFILALVLLSGILAANARPYTWTAWLRYGRHMTLVNSAGESLREVDLPLPDGYEMTENTIAVSPSGRLVAYLIRKGQHSAEVVIYNTENSATVMNYPIESDDEIWGTSWFAANEEMFNDNETVIAFGYTTFNQRTTSGDWQLVALDLASGTSLYQLSGHEMIQRGLIANYLWTPLIRRYRGTEITFTLDILENEGNPTTFIWNTATGDIRPSVTFPNLKSELFAPTGEIVSPLFGGQPIPVPESQNTSATLTIFDPILGGRYTFYQSTSLMPDAVKFVQNGEAILIETSNEWTLLGRDGKVIDEWSPLANITTENLDSIPDGFLYTARLAMPNETATLPIPVLMAVNTRDDQLDAGQSIWHLSMDEYRKRAGGNDVPLEIVWVHSDAPAGPFMPWAQLDTPVYEPAPPTPESLPAPTMIPTPEALFQVGMTVRVQTTGGEILNLRTDHTREADVIMYLENKMELTLLEGPVQAEGFTWWRIRTSDGVEGWTVENNHDLQTLMPE